MVHQCSNDNLQYDEESPPLKTMLLICQGANVCACWATMEIGTTEGVAMGRPCINGDGISQIRQNRCPIRDFTVCNIRCVYRIELILGE